MGQFHDEGSPVHCSEKKKKKKKHMKMQIFIHHTITDAMVLLIMNKQPKKNKTENCQHI